MERLSREEEFYQIVREVYSLPTEMRSDWVLQRLAHTFRAMDNEGLRRFQAATRYNGATVEVVNLLEGHIALREILSSNPRDR